MLFPTLESIATKDIVSVEMSQTVNDAIQVMRQSRHEMLIVKSRELYYLLTTRDLVRFQVENISFDTPLSQISLHIIPTFPKEQNIISVLGTTNNRLHEYFCLTDEHNQLCGIVTNSDIIASVDPQIMMDKIPISSIFDKQNNYIIVRPDDKISETISQMVYQNVDCLIVFDDDNCPIGIITSKDILQIMYAFEGGRDTVEAFMSHPIQTLVGNATILQAIEFSQNKHFKRIIVTDEKHKLLGIITQKELIAQTYLRWSGLVKDHFAKLNELSAVLEEQNRQLSHMAAYDQLTGLHNRYFFIELFNKEYSYAKRHDGFLFLILMDIDRFKNINDTYGHNIGDAVLCEVATLCKDILRAYDLFARWGGEEFVILLPCDTNEDGLEVAEKTRLAVQNHTFSHIGKLTCSFGVSRTVDGDTLETLIERADKALYIAKSDGRNCVRKESAL